jgi:hypothetical protein
MPRRSKGPRLWLRRAQYDQVGRLTHAAVWLIKDGKHRESTGRGADDRGGAEAALARYLNEKQLAHASTGIRQPASTPVADVLALYGRDVAPKHARPHETGQRIRALLSFFGDKVLSDINGSLCRGYVEHRGATGAARRELEDLRAAINHHRREGLCSAIIEVAVPEPSPPRDRWLTRSEAARLLWAAWHYRERQKGRLTDRRSRQHIAKFILVALYTGTRASAVCGAAMLMKKLLPASGIAFIGGQSGAGKTFVAIALGVALAAGIEFFKHKTVGPVGVAYIAAEGAAMFAARVAGAKLAAGIKTPLPFAWIDNIPALQTPEGLAAFTSLLRSLREQMLQRFGVRLGAVFIDTVAACFSLKDENANAEVSTVCRLMRQIGQSIDAIVIPVHHYGKDADTGLRGASAWRGAADVVISVTADIDQLSGRATNRALAIAKARDEEQGAIAAFVLEWVKLGVDADGEEFGTCIVKLDLQRSAQILPRSKAPKRVQVFDQASRIALGENGEEVHLTKGGPKIRAVELKHVKAKFCSMYVTGEVEPNKADEAIGRAWRRVLQKLPDEYVSARGQDGRELIWLKATSSAG